MMPFGHGLAAAVLCFLKASTGHNSLLQEDQGMRKALRHRTRQE